MAFSSVDRSGSSSHHDLFPYHSSLDGLREIAIILVLSYHAPFLFRDLPEFAAGHLPWAALGMAGVISLGGWIGVDLFFVVSGFLITSILLRLREKTVSPWVFWSRRGLRIFPLAFVYVASLLILVSLGDPLQMLPRFDGWAWYAFYLGNVHISLYGWQPLAVMILWSLAIEEQFYVMWPLLVRVCSERRVLLWSGAFMLVAPLTRALMSQEYPATYVFTLCRVDALAAGAIVAVLFASEKRWVEIAPWLNRLAPLAGIPIVTTLLAPFSPSFPETRPWFFTVFGYSCLAVSFAILLAVCLERRGLLGTLLTSPPLRFLGKRCYGLYVWHVVVAALVTAGLRPWQAGFHIHVLIWFAALLVVASASWVLLEQPILRLKDYLPYAQPRTGRTEVRLVA